MREVDGEGHAQSGWGLEITTQRLILRPFRTEDAPALHVLFADPEAMRFWSTPPHQSLAETEDFVNRTIHAAKTGTGDDRVVLMDGRIVGKAGLWNNLEIGFIFAPGVWGAGVASEAVRAVLAHEAGKGKAEILADVDPRNAACIRLLTRTGFVQTGMATHTAQIGAQWVDSLYFKADLRRAGPDARQPGAPWAGR